MVLLDFGIVRIEQLHGDGPLISGSPHYMAPEAIRGQVRRGEAHRVDLYALGVIGFVMLTGGAPFDHTNAVEILLQHLEQPVPSARERRAEVPARLDALLAALLAKSPDERPSDIEVVLAELRQLRAR